ncbi:MAG: AbrB/MazE/SpoVT family DNA-binding domain-containing protein [Candidatus Aenigmarchaeota archaeon]|nr:AbrB/MazE/SpoVT family DNA-binding domain-containing protein [Candidatus Aenigmarchaeota archaeon]
MRKEIEIPELTKVSSKGQLVIPADVRKKFGIKEGSVFAISTKKDMIVLRKLNTKIKAEDLRTLKLIEEAWEDIAKNRYKVYTKEAFYRVFKKW